MIKTDYWQSSTSVTTQQNNFKNNFETSIKYPSQNAQPDRFSPPIQAPIIQAPSQTVKNQPQPITIPNNYPNSNQVQQTVNNNKPTVKNDIFYNPKNENTSYNLGAFASSKVEEVKDIRSVTSNVAPGKKKPFGLNVS